MKIRFALALALLALTLAAATPPPALPASIAECLDRCDAIRATCDAGCSTSQCHRECRDSAVQCVRRCQTGG
jgi:hypothetical protein